MTREEHVARLKQEFPTLTAVEDGEERTLTPEEYEARIAEWADNAVRHEAEEAAQEARVKLRRKYRWARTILDQPVGTTQAQVRQNVIEHRTILSGLLEILKDAGLALDD